MFLLERFVTKSDLSQIEKYADRLFAKVGIDVEFTRHFVDRVNDERNKKQISVAELVRIFNKAYQKYGKAIARLGPDAEAVMKDMRTDINMPFVLKLMRNGMLELVAKTIMRKKDFKTSNKTFPVESCKIHKKGKTLKEVTKYDKTNVSLVQRQSITENFLGRINSHRSFTGSTASPISRYVCRRSRNTMGNIHNNKRSSI
tara:strand:+ start:86 stop:688 length:603 start_codon:yes stop_codon:yes gene_type:complete